MTDTPEPALERTLVVVNPMGIHARPATKIVELTNAYDSQITFSKNGEEVDGKSIFGVMTLAANQGTTLLASARGSDAKEALDALEDLFRRGFDEMQDAVPETEVQENKG